MGLTLQQLQAMGGQPGVTNTPSPTSGGQNPTGGTASPPSIKPIQQGGLSLSQLKAMGGQPGVTPAPPTASSSPAPTGLLGQLGGRFNDAKAAFSQNINPISGGLQLVGAGAGAINDTAGAALGLIPGVKSIEGEVGKGVGALENTGAGQAVTGAYNNFTTAHPELSNDINAVGNIVGAAGLVTGAGELKDAGADLLGKVTGNTELNGIASDVAPDLKTSAQVSSAKGGGLIKKGLSGKIVPAITDDSKAVAAAVQDNVPGFSKLATYTDKLNATRDAVYGLADDLKQKVISSGKDIIYPFKELKADMDAVQPEIRIKSDNTLNNQFNLTKNAALNLAKDSGGNISGLFDARKAFDDLVNKQFPDLYAKENAPMRDAVTKMRGVMNNFIEEKLPTGSGFKSALQTQSKLFRAIDGLAPKAVDEIGSTRFSRFAGEHPTISGTVKKVLPYAAATAIGGGTGAAVSGLYHHLFGGS